MRSSSHDTVTRVVQRPDGSEVLRLRRAVLAVIAGPDTGLALDIDRPRVVVGSGDDCDLTLHDRAVSKQHLAIDAVADGYRIRDLDSTNGSFIAGLRLGQVLARTATQISLGETELSLRPSDAEVELPLSARLSLGSLLGESVEMRYLFALLERLARSDTTVLLEGESGTGKELAAEALHSVSPRAEGPFIVVDCGAIPENLIESELFGHERGAFTGADRARVGAFEEANGGTVFLDEIGELPLSLQPKLLRVLEGRQIKRVGDTRYRAVDVRIVAATNRKLDGEVAQGRFRQDLFYRLSVARVQLPALRDRPDDIRLLAHHFAQQHVDDSHALIDRDVESLLLAYHWPGNVRQLRNVIEQMAIMPEAAARALQGAPPIPTRGGSGGDVARELERSLPLSLHEGRRRWQERFDRFYLAEQLARADGVVTHAAEAADIPRQTFNRLLKRYGLRDDS
ncbi:MAG: sigma 54-dependent Fis family transcriptional regulator [Myxococcales bacterium]|nr:sigma 54-dependent Fis family transcriptional regulator [Myxococcales bacterium]